LHVIILFTVEFIQFTDSDQYHQLCYDTSGTKLLVPRSSRIMLGGDVTDVTTLKSPIFLFRLS
jgi:hypothetical protein